MDFKFEKKRLYGLLGQSLVETLKEYNCFIAGGTITSLFCNRDIKDYDIYFRSKKEFIAFMFDIWDSQNWIVSSTDKATAINMDGKDVQVIHFKFFENVDEIFETFDYSVCMGAFDFKTEEFQLHPDFLRHNSQRVLSFNPGTAFPIVSLLRVAKYQDKGYSISKTELIKVVMTCMKLSESINSYEQLKDQLGGMYGINYDKMFEDIEDEEFSFEKAIEYISELPYDDKYYEIEEFDQFCSVEELLANIVGDIGLKYFITQGKFGRKTYYIVYPNGNLKSSNHKPKTGEEIKITDFFKETKLYKYVEKTPDGIYKSFYDSKYEWKIGVEMVPEKENYLYFNTFGNLSRSPYCHKDNKAILEVEFDPEDLVSLGTSYSAEVLLKKCRVIREVPKDEHVKSVTIDDDYDFTL